MNTRKNIGVGLAFSGLFAAGGLMPLMWAPGCAEVDDGSVEIATTGAHSVPVGETVALSAETVRGTDNAYSWSTSDEAIATVTDDGVVTGVAMGEVTITVEGEDTGASGSHPVVVTDPSGIPDEVPYRERWSMSAHADASAEAFNHWNEDGEIPTSCARCHSRAGFRDYIGNDGSEVGVVNQPAPTGSVIDCQTCHNDAAAELGSATFPSGVTVEGLGGEARCMTCHQGRGSTDDVDAAIAESGAGPDEVSETLSFENIHYFPAAATLLAGKVRGGYQYEEQVYDRRFRHVPEYDTCIDCHDPHSTGVRVDACGECHDGVSDITDIRDIRMIASRNVDYDGDGNTSQGIYYEVEGLRAKLYTAIQKYASEVAGQPICYAAGTYPYWFQSETGQAAECTDEEAAFENAFGSWTPRLLQATYNYQMGRTDPGAYVHNGRYIIKLLHDSIVDLNGMISDPVDMSGAERNAPGHFNGASEAARHWDENEAVSAACSRCHSGAIGFRFFTEFGVGIEVPETANGLECYTCHDNFGSTFDVTEVDVTRYPGGAATDHEGHDDICATCHSGRESKATIDQAIAAGNLGFRNVHYLPAAAVRNGSTTHIGYEYEGKTYAGFLQHDSRTQCAGCHEPAASKHTFRIEDVWDSACNVCHNDQDGPEGIRLVHLADYDGDGDGDESLADELDGLSARLAVAIQAAAPSPICYSGDTYPYWFVDRSLVSDGFCTEMDASYDNRFEGWTPELMRAAHNFQLEAKEPGAYAHNFEYMAQLLIDSIEALGQDVGDLVRP